MVICPRPAARYVWERFPRYFEALRREQLQEALACRLAVTAAGVLRLIPMDPEFDPEDVLARVRARRHRALVDELLPKLRRLNPMWSDEEILDTAESMAELRLLDEEIG